MQVTSDAMVDALTSPYPSTRYVVASIGKGIPAWAATWMAWLLPDRVLDIVALKF